MKKYLVGGLAIFLLIGCEVETSQEQKTEPAVKETEMAPIERENNDHQVQEMAQEPPEKKPTIEEPKAIYEINQANWTIEPIEEGEKQVVLLTIDDAPDQYAIDMAETLQKLEVDAIFFVNGHFIDTDDGKEKLKKIYEMGFEIGNHTMTHPNLGEISEEQQRTEIVQLNELVEGITGEQPRFFRAPFGLNTEVSRQVMQEENMTAMNWTYGYDWEQEYQNKESLTEVMVGSPYLTEGANLLMHDRSWTAEALEEIVNGLKEKGYTFVDPQEIKESERE